MMEVCENIPNKKKHKKEKKSRENEETRVPILEEPGASVLEETSPKKKSKKRKEIPYDNPDNEFCLTNSEINEDNFDQSNLKKKKKKHKRSSDVENIININIEDPLDNEMVAHPEVFIEHCNGTSNNNNDSNLLTEESSLLAEGKSLKKKCKKSKKNISDNSIIETNSIKENDMNETNIEDSVPKKKKKKKKISLDGEENVGNSDDAERIPKIDRHNDVTNESHTSNPLNIISVKEKNDNKLPNNVNSNFSKPNLDDFENAPKWLKKCQEKSNYSNFNETIPLGKKGRHYTVSIALPASILKETCLLQELRTYVIGQLARAACIYAVDEIVIFDDNWLGGFAMHQRESIEECIGMMKMILEYQECPQYLRKDFFPKHDYMRKASLLNACNSTHHLLAHQWCTYREGVVTEKTSGKNSFADVGLKSEVEIDRKIEPGLRVTVKFPPETETMKKLYGYVVSPEEPRTKCGLYWGYTVRVANSLSEVFKSDRFKDGYDLIIGTSDKGTDVNKTEFKHFKHALIVFGGVEGLEAAIKADESITAPDPQSLFHYYLNTCPNQQSRTIRTEEAVLITLCSLSHSLAMKGNNRPE